MLISDRSSCMNLLYCIVFILLTCAKLSELHRPANVPGHHKLESINICCTLIWILEVPNISQTLKFPALWHPNTSIIYYTTIKQGIWNVNIQKYRERTCSNFTRRPSPGEKIQKNKIQLKSHFFLTVSNLCLIHYTPYFKALSHFKCIYFHIKHLYSRRILQERSMNFK